MRYNTTKIKDSTTGDWNGIPAISGKDGKTFQLLGMYPTLAALKADHPIGNYGDAYVVGTASSNTVYNWDVKKKDWVDVGPLKSSVSKINGKSANGAGEINLTAGDVGAPTKEQHATLEQGLQSHTRSRNPHGMTAGDINAYTKEQTNEAISSAIGIVIGGAY